MVSVVCPLMPSCNTYHLTWVSHTLGVGYLFMAAPAKHSCCFLPWTWGSSSRAPLLTLGKGYLLPASAPDLGHGVSLHGLRACPWAWGSSSRPSLPRRCAATPVGPARPCLGRASGRSQENAPVAVLLQPMGHAVWYRVRAAEVPADSEVSSLSLLVKKRKSLVLKRTKAWESTGPTSQVD